MPFCFSWKIMSCANFRRCVKKCDTFDDLQDILYLKKNKTT